MTPALLALAVALLVCVCAEIQENSVLKATAHSGLNYRTLSTELPHGCLYEGRWHMEGAIVATREACLSCVCGRGALSCRRRACVPLPDPPPKRCHVLHRRGACCPELHCQNGVIVMEHGASARVDHDDFTDIATPSSATHVCVEDGAVFSAGSALASRVACEQCFCLGGARRCVRPRCLPPPPACEPRAAPGACCPQRYYCQHDATTTEPHTQHDCKVEGKWVQEGDRVPSPSNSTCVTCFCLRGAVRCQPLACAPPLLGCKPLLRPGECCAHQYNCNHREQEQYSSYFKPVSNALTSMRNDDRSLHSSKATSLESTTNKILTSAYTLKNTPISSATHNQHITTTKVKRKTNDPPPETSSKIIENATVTTTTEISKQAAKIIATEETTTEITTEPATQQPDGTVKIIINGTINCTAELSSTSLPLNITVTDANRIKMEALPRVPIMNTEIEAQTYSPNDIITDRNVNSNFDDNETFTINVTSSLNTNTSLSTLRPVVTSPKLPVKMDLGGALNSSKKTKGDYDYDYTEPTLPPSLPNLKIIPFVAADAVVDEDKSKDELTYPILEREDKFPVYYHNVEKDVKYATRREDLYHPTKYPVFVSDKEPQYPSLTHDADLTSNRYYSDMGAHDYTVSMSLDSHVSDTKTVTKVPSSSSISTFELATPDINLFSPPVETEGGFIPKGPGIIDEYYAVYPSTPPAPAVPHLTTSMQLDIGECITPEGLHVAEGETVSLACSECRCVWARLQCAPVLCHTPPHCSRGSTVHDTVDNCCGQLICNDNATSTQAPVNDKINQSKLETMNHTENLLAISTTHESPKITTHTDNSTISSTTTRLSSTVHTTQLTTTEKVPIVPAIDKHANDTNTQDYEEDDDEGFSFGSVLKLLLSDNYDTTTAAPNQKPVSILPTKPTPSTVLPTRKPSTIAPFIPMPPHSFIPSKKAPTTVNRIDHLVLGEATAIKKTTPRPITTTKANLKTKPVVEETHFVTHEGPRPPNLGSQSTGVGSGLLKLAGCNIYGRMYRVGRIITELSTPCQECWCTELGVQCKQLGC